MEYELNFKKNNVAIFLDICGFSNKIKKANDNFETNVKNSAVANLSTIFEILSKSYNDNAKKYGITFFWISDSIIIAGEEIQLNVILAFVSDIFYRLLSARLIFKGGMSFGNLYLSDTNVIGTPVIEAVNIEKETKYFGIAVDKRFYSKLKELNVFDFFTDADDNYYFNEISYFNASRTQDAIETYLRGMNEIIKENYTFCENNIVLAERYYCYASNAVDAIFLVRDVLYKKCENCGSNRENCKICYDYVKSLKAYKEDLNKLRNTVGTE